MVNIGVRTLNTAPDPTLPAQWLVLGRSGTGNRLKTDASASTTGAHCCCCEGHDKIDNTGDALQLCQDDRS